MYPLLSSGIPMNPRNQKMLKDIEAAALQYEKEPIKSLLFSQYRIYFETGSRIEYEADYIEHRRRMNVYAAMVLSSEGRADEERWVKGLEDILWAICDEFTWAFPAHMKDETDLEGSWTTVDLFASETGLAVTEICHLVGNKISSIVRNRVEYEVRRRLLNPYIEKELKWHRNNWSSVCAGCIGMMLLYWDGLEGYRPVEKRILNSMDDFLSSYQDDGCCLEGALYWGYGFGYFCYFAAMVREYTGGECDLFQMEKVKQIALFRQKIYMEKNVAVPFADAPHNYNYHIGLIHFLAKEYEEVEVPDEAYGVWFDDDIRHRFADFIRDLYWYDPELPPRTVPQGRVLFEESQWYFERREKYTFAAKGGRNNEPHNHNDLGHFIIYSNGRFILDDLGWPEYDGDYFGEKRYENICAASEGHSVPILGGSVQVRGGDHYSRLLGQSGDKISFDLTPAYPKGSCQRLIRTFETKEDQVVMQDEITGVNGVVKERFVTRILPQIKGKCVEIDGWMLECQESEVEITVSEKMFEPRLSICKMDMKPVETAYLIDFKAAMEGGAKTLTFIVKNLEG